jgi:hypothetical protein
VVSRAPAETGAVVFAADVMFADDVVSALLLATTVESVAAMVLSAAATGTVVDETGIHGCVVGIAATCDVVGSELAGVAIPVVSGVLVGDPVIVESALAVVAPADVVSGVLDCDPAMVESALAVVAPADVVSGVLDGVPAMVESADVVLAPGVVVDGSTQSGRVVVISTGSTIPDCAGPQAIPRNVIAIAAIAFFIGFP